MLPLQDSQNTLKQKLIILEPHWADASIFLEFLNAGEMHASEIEKLLGYIIEAENITETAAASALHTQTKSLLQSLRSKEALEREQEQRFGEINILF